MTASAGRTRRVALLIGTLEVGGAEGQLFELATRLARDRWEVRVFSFIPGGGLEAAFREAGIECRPLRPVRVVSTSFRAWRRALSGTVTAWRLWRELRRWTPDVVHAFLPEAGAVAALATPTYVPLIVSTRSLRMTRSRNAWDPRIQRLANRRAARILVNSRAVAHDVETAEGAPRTKVRLVYNGVDVERFCPPATARTGRVRFGMLANFIPYKRQSLVIEAFGRLAPNTDAELVLWGRGGVNLEECQRLVRARGLGERVRFPGPAVDAATALRDLDVLVSASTEEGFSNSILEAMATGLPVVATAVGGAVEQLEHGRTGLIVPSEDVDALASALQQLVSDRDLRRRLGDAARLDVAARFSMAAMVAGTEDVYDELTSDPTAARAAAQRGR